MPSSHVILPDRHIVYIRQAGIVTFEEGQSGFAAWCADPMFHPTQSWLMDCSAVTYFDTDPLLMMNFQARLLPALLAASDPALMVLYAPRPGPGRDIAVGILKTWDGLGRRLPRLSATEQEALDILGQPERSFAALLATAPDRTLQPRPPT